MKEKRSFFERLTGTVRIDDDMPEAEPEVRERTIHPSSGGSAIPRESDWAREDEGEGQLTVDVYQTPDDIVIRTMVAGVDPNDLDVAITRDMVTIKGKREGTREITDEDYFYKELYWGSFSRTIMLPQEVEVEEAEAVQKHGLLTIRLPKIDKGRQTKLKIKMV
jgi:HSP20 family protein